jgi:hypothetical protein
MESRLAAVERQLRLHRLVIAGLLVTLVALVSYGATEEVPDVIRAKRIEAESSLIVGELKGAHFAVAANTADEELVLIGGASPEKSLFLLAKEKDLPAHSLNFYNTSVNLWGGGKKAVQLLSVGTAGAIFVNGFDGKFGVGLFGKGSDGGGAVEIYNKTGETVVQIYADEYGMGYLGAFDRQGKGRTLTPR